VRLTQRVGASECAASADKAQAQRAAEGDQDGVGREQGEGRTRASLGKEFVVSVALVECDFPE
jgi:hypothetical protein